MNGPDPVTTMATTTSLDRGDSVNVLRLDGGPGTVVPIDGDAFALRADGGLLAFVTQQDVATPQEKDILHLVQVTG